MGSAKLPCPVAAPSCLAAFLEGEHSPTSPAQAELGTGEGPRPLSLPSPTPDLSCQGPGPSGLG